VDVIVDEAEDAAVARGRLGLEERGVDLGFGEGATAGRIGEAERRRSALKRKVNVARPTLTGATSAAGPGVRVATTWEPRAAGMVPCWS
jgi:hypothetical protein